MLHPVSLRRLALAGFLPPVCAADTEVLTGMKVAVTAAATPGLTASSPRGAGIGVWGMNVDKGQR